MEIDNITSVSQIETAISSPTVIILKHSTRCPISRGIKERFESFAKNAGTEISLYIIDIISYPGLSNTFAERTGIRHESPQVILFRSGEPVWNESHWNITQESLNKAVQEFSR